MDSQWIMYIGFFLAVYTVVGNDVIQTLGTFIASNEQRVQWKYLWAYIACILVVALVYGYYQNDLSYGRLDKFNLSNQNYTWHFLLPPLVLLFITKLGIPVSTTFMILTMFSITNMEYHHGSMVREIFDSNTKLGMMIEKSMVGYCLSFFVSLIFYISISSFIEKIFSRQRLKTSSEKWWIIGQWLSTGFLWFQWLTQDLANIYVYLRGGQDLSFGGFMGSLLILVGLLAYVFYQKGGKIQKIVLSKTNTTDIRSATIVDLFYGLLLYTFKYNYLGLFEAKLPMSTTWVFIGLLAGREIGIQLSLKKTIPKKIINIVLFDLLKVFIGLVISVLLALLISILVN